MIYFSLDEPLRKTTGTVEKMQCSAIMCVKGKSWCLVQRRHPIGSTAHHTKTSFLIDWCRMSSASPSIWTVLLELFLSSKNIEILHVIFIKKKKKRNMFLICTRKLRNCPFAWHAAVHGVAKSWTRLNDWTETIISPFCFSFQNYFAVTV